MYNLTQKAALDRARQKRQSEQYTGGQNEETIDQYLDRMGITDPLQRARMKTRLVAQDGKISRIPDKMLGAPGRG